MSAWVNELQNYLDELQDVADYIDSVDKYEAEEAGDMEALAKAETAYERITETLEKLEDALNSVKELVLDNILG